MWVFSGVLIASVTATALQLYKQDPAALRSALAALTQSYLLNADDPIGFHVAGRLLEGLGLIAAAAQIGQRETRDRLRLLACLVASGVVASMAAVFWQSVSLLPPTLARQAANGLARYSAVTGDVNAAASSYLLLVFAAVGVATVARGERAWRCWRPRPCSPQSCSRVRARADREHRRGDRGCAAKGIRDSPTLEDCGALVLVLMVGSAVAFVRSARSVASLKCRRFHPDEPAVDRGTTSLRHRGRTLLFTVEANAAAVAQSGLWPRKMPTTTTCKSPPVGIVGLVAFMWVLGAALTTQLKRVWRGEANGLMAGCLAGTFAYLVTALAGHPFLVPETAIPFWVVLGLAMHPSGALARADWPGRVAIGLACVLLLTALFRGAVPARLPPGDYGFGPWQPTLGATVSQPTRPQAFSWAPRSAVEIPMRLGSDGSGHSALVAVIVPGSARTEKQVGADWTTQVVPLPGAEVLEPSQRINLVVSVVGAPAPAQASSHVDIGQVRVVAAK
jgi:hypothetical protein